MKNYSNITATGHTLTPFNTVNDITDVYFSNQITSIGSFLFYFCQGITTIDVPSSVTTIGERAFVGCQNIQTLILHEGLLSIEDQAFFGTSISKLQLPNSVQYIGDEAFSDTELEGEFFVSANVQFIGKAVIAHTGISSITTWLQLTEEQVALFQNAIKQLPDLFTQDEAMQLFEKHNLKHCFSRPPSNYTFVCEHTLWELDKNFNPLFKNPRLDT